MTYGIVMAQVRSFETLDEMKAFLRDIMGRLGDQHVGRGKPEDAVATWNLVDAEMSSELFNDLERVGAGLFIMPIQEDDGTTKPPYAFLALGPQYLDRPEVQGVDTHYPNG